MYAKFDSNTKRMKTVVFKKTNGNFIFKPITPEQRRELYTAGYNNHILDNFENIQFSEYQLSPEEQKQQRISEIKGRLSAIDNETCPRVVREYLLSVGYEGYKKKDAINGVIKDAELEAQDLRNELAALST